MKHVHINLLYKESFSLRITPEKKCGFDMVLEVDGTQELMKGDRGILWADELAYFSEVIAVRDVSAFVIENTEIV